MLSINFNPTLLGAQNKLNIANNSLNTSLKRLSTGLRINSASDDAAGYYVSQGLNSQIRGLKTAQSNIALGSSLLGTAEGRLEFIPSNMQHNRYFVSRDCFVFGIAHGKREAYDMISHILTQIYAEHAYDSVADFLREVSGESIC